MSEVNEVKNVHDNFYGYGYFYPGLYTPDEAWQQKEMVQHGLWPLAMDICFAAGVGNCYVSRVHPQGHSILLTDKQGLPLMEVKGDSNSYEVSNWHRHLKQRGRNRYAIHSAKRPYVVKAVQPFIEPIRLDAQRQLNSNLVQAAQSVNEYLNNATNNAVNIANQTLTPESAYMALRLIFDADYNKLQVEQAALNRLEAVYKDLCNKFANKKSYADRLHDMFDHSKWLVAHIPMYGMNFLIIGSVKLTPTELSYAGRYKLAYEIMPHLYRSFDQFYAAHSDEEGSLKTALMFCKVHREKDTAEAKSYDKEGFIPCNARGVYEDIGGISWCGAYAGAVLTSPSYLLLQK